MYKSAIGSLIYLSKCTRSKISFAINKASKENNQQIQTGTK